MFSSMCYRSIELHIKPNKLIISYYSEHILFSVGAIIYKHITHKNFSETLTDYVLAGAAAASPGATSSARSHQLLHIS